MSGDIAVVVIDDIADVVRKIHAYKLMFRNCGLFVAVYAEFLSDGHQIPSSEFDSGLHHARYASLLWDYEINQAFTGMLATIRILLD
ncbi:hypothetical protein BC332_23373 [Capsicum chinense]|nr:hypothetical protein BC332_23373 [Capsicum chinense]